MTSFEKQLKSGLKKCPLHKYGADYYQVQKNWFQCNTCKAYHFVEDRLLEEAESTEVRITSGKLGIYKTTTYEFKENGK